MNSVTKNAWEGCILEVKDFTSQTTPSLIHTKYCVNENSLPLRSQQFDLGLEEDGSMGLDGDS